MTLFKILLLSCLLFQLSFGALLGSEQTILVNWYNSLSDPGELEWDLGADLCGQTAVTCDGPDPQRITALSYSGVTYNVIIGTLPTEFGLLTNLQVIDLNVNYFTSTIPTEFGLLTNLQRIDLHANQFTGPIPTEFGNLMNIQRIELYGNQLSGPLPTQFGNLVNLEYLQLQVNHLTGPIPTQLENLKNWTNIYLSGNYWDCPVLNYSNIASVADDYFSAASDCGTSCPDGRCTIEQVCSVRSSGGYNCADLPPHCGNYGILVNEQCACSSGYLGTNCTTYLGGSCSFPTSSPIKTQALGELNVNNITNSLVEVIISVPGVEKRTVTSIVFGDSISSSNDPICEYPGPSFTKNFDDSLCQDTFTSSISVVNLIQNCGFDLDTGDTGSFKEYDGRIWATFVENLGSFRGLNLTRTVSSSLNLILSLPSTVVVHGSISLFGVAEAVFVLTDQSYDETTDSGVIIITSILTYPFKFNNATFIGLSAFTIENSISEDQTCEESSGDCVQTTTFIIQDISSNGCTFSGDYQFEWNQGCRGSNCPSEMNSMNVTVSLESSNVCSTIKVYSSISGTLESYDQDDYSSIQSNFIIGDTIYFEAEFVSDVEVDHYELVNLYIVSDSNQRYLFQDGSITTIGTSNSLSSSDIQFSFGISVGTNDDDDLIISASSDIAITFEVFAEYEIFYKTTFKKRSIQSQQLGLSKQISLVSNK